MGNQPIEICGITPISHFPKLPPHHPCTQFCEIDKLCIPCHKATIDSIKQICFKVCIDSFKIICTPAGRKLVIDGKKQLKIFFCPNNPSSSIHSVDFDIPFCTFILLKDSQDEVTEVCSVVEDITVKCLDYKCLAITSIIFVCPVFKKNSPFLPTTPTHETGVQPDYSMKEHCPHDKKQCNCHSSQDHYFQQDHSCQVQCQSLPVQLLCKNCQSHPGRYNF